MDDEKKEMTAPDVSVGADTEQSSPVDSLSIPDKNEKSNPDIENLQHTGTAHELVCFSTVSATELLETTYHGKLPLVKDLLYPGTILFAGAPKVGKSFLMLQIAYHVSKGLPLWDKPVQQGTVLYLALEDTYSRLQDRLVRMFDAEGSDHLYFSVSARKIGHRLREQLQAFVTEHPDTRLIIIDTLQKVREACADGYSYSNDYLSISALKKFADKHDLCLILVHHTRKQPAGDGFETISGTNGLHGAADGAMLLSKVKRTSNIATLDITNRDQQDQRLHLMRNEKTLAWELDHEEIELWKAPPEPLLDEVAARITADNPRWEGTPTDLVSFLTVDMKPNVLTNRLNINAPRLMREYGIAYTSRRSHSGRKVTLIYRGLPQGETQQDQQKENTA